MATAYINVRNVTMMAAVAISLPASGAGPENAALLEALQCMSRGHQYFENRLSNPYESQPQLSESAAPTLWDMNAAESRMRALADAHSIDFDGLLSKAAIHFQAEGLQSYNEQMTQAELDAVIDQDDDSFKS